MFKVELCLGELSKKKTNIYILEATGINYPIEAILLTKARERSLKTTNNLLMNYHDSSVEKIGILRPIPKIATLCPLAHHLEHRMVRCPLELPDQLREQLGPLADDLFEVTRHLPRHRQQHVGVFAQLLGELDRRGL